MIKPLSLALALLGTTATALAEDDQPWLLGNWGGQRSALAEKGVEFEIVATNVSDAPVTMEFRNGQVFDLWILGTDGALVWRWASGRMFTQALREIRLLPGESASRRVVWPGTDASGDIQIAGPLVARADWVSPPARSSQPLSFVAEQDRH